MTCKQTARDQKTVIRFCAWVRMLLLGLLYGVFELPHQHHLQNSLQGRGTEAGHNPAWIFCSSTLMLQSE